MSFPVYEEYKDSGVEWLGEIPSYWSSIELKYVCTNQPSNVDKKSVEGQASVLLCNYTDVYYNEQITSDLNFMQATATEEQIDKFTLLAGDVIITKDSETADDIAVPAYVPEDLPGVICGYHLAMIRPKDGVNGAYIKRLFDSNYVRSRVATLANGLTRVGLSHAAISGLEIPFPPLPEQTAIASFLDSETSKIDSLVSKQRRLIELLKEKRQAVISHAVTKGLDPSVPMKDSGIEWLGEVPEGWEILPVQRLAKQGNKTFTDGDWIERPYVTDSGVRLLQTGNVGIGNFREKGFRYVSNETFDDLKCTEVLPGDVLICRLDGPVGRACLAPDLGVRMITSVDNAILKVADDVVSEFVVHVFTSMQWLSWVEAICRVGGGFRLRISRSMLGNSRVPVPPHEEQLEITKHIATETDRFNSLEAQAERAIELLQERRTALISAAVTGKIDVREFAYQETA